MEENVEVVETKVETGEVVDVKEGFFTKAKRGLKKARKAAVFIAVGVGGALIGSAIAKAKNGKYEDKSVEIVNNEDGSFTVKEEEDTVE